MTASAKTRFDFGKLARTYDRWYETPEGRAHDRLQKAAVRRLLPSPDRGPALLDVGCGTGHWSRFFAAHGFAVTAIDISFPMVRQAQRRGVPDCHFAMADARRMPFPDEAFHVAAAMAVIAFVSEPGAVVAELVRCVRRDGAVIIGALNRLARLNLERVAQGKEPYASARLFSPDELYRLLQPYGTVTMAPAAGFVSAAENAPGAAFMVARLNGGKAESPVKAAAHPASHSREAQ